MIHIRTYKANQSQKKEEINCMKSLLKILTFGLSGTLSSICISGRRLGQISFYLELAFKLPPFYMLPSFKNTKIISELTWEVLPLETTFSTQSWLQKARKMAKKRIYQLKYMSKRSHRQKLRPFSLYFEPFQVDRKPFTCEFKEDSYVFGIR